MVLRGCGEIREAEVERIVAAELGSQSANEPEPTDPTWILGSCQGSRVLLEVVDVVSRKTLRRNFDFGRASPKARARLIAIASSELVLASWAELALHPHLRVEPEGPAPLPERKQAASARASQPHEHETPLDIAAAEAWAGSEDLPPAPRQRWFDELPPERRRFRITALGSMRNFFTTDGALLGGGLRLSEERLVLTCWSLDALYETGAFELGGRDYRVDSWSLGGMLYVYGRGRFVTGRIGAGLRAGLSAATTTQSSPEGLPPPPSTRVLTPWGWPMLAASASLGRPPIAFELAIESGYVAVPIAPSSQGGVSLRGVWFAAQVGLSLFL
ncbi:MAG: hypothetical protein ACOY0T_10910 [Myxococcota bacterium]